MISKSELIQLASCGSVLPRIMSKTGSDDEPITEIIICDSVSGGAQYENNMPKRLSLFRKLMDGTEYFAEYVQTRRVEMPTGASELLEPIDAAIRAALTSDEQGRDVMKKASELLETNDAAIWAAEFERCKQKNNWTLDDIDESLMIGWFANAMAAQEFKDNRGKKL